MVGGNSRHEKTSGPVSDLDDDLRGPETPRIDYPFFRIDHHALEYDYRFSEALERLW